MLIVVIIHHNITDTVLRGVDINNGSVKIIKINMKGMKGMMMGMGAMVGRLILGSIIKATMLETMMKDIPGSTMDKDIITDTATSKDTITDMMGMKYKDTIMRRITLRKATELRTPLTLRQMMFGQQPQQQ